MSEKKMAAERLLSKPTVEKLDAAIYKNNMEQLKKLMEKLFTFKNIFSLHDDHLIQLAENIVDIAHENDRLSWIHNNEPYVRTQINKYQERKKKIVAENQWAKAAGHLDKVEKLDLTYRLWVYDAGFEYSKYQMFTMILGIFREVEEYEKKKMDKR